MIKSFLEKLSGKIPLKKKRHKNWSKFRKVYLKTYPRCAVCGSYKKLEVHHIIPFHVMPELELDPSNLIVLCESKKYGINCHLLMGHLGNYKKYNLNVVFDVMQWREKLK